ncbi:Y+L amino acid transporter 2 [Procambarus clarkii]|uniref:Y+L amino acid transporter 2 n=1 Tax=Procambarus clarkii TaxID=6728 RepID=UPI003743CBA8
MGTASSREIASTTDVPQHSSSETQRQEAASKGVSTPKSSVCHRRSSGLKKNLTAEATTKNKSAVFDEVDKTVDGMTASGKYPDTGGQLKRGLQSAGSGEPDGMPAPGKCPDTGGQLKKGLRSAGSGEADGMTAPGKCPDTGGQQKKGLRSAGSGEPDGMTVPGKCLDTGVQLKRALGLGNGVGMIVGIVIGSGIFVSPKTVVQYTGSVGMALVVWVATGLVSIVGALCYAELGTTIPRNGANYAYIMEAFGPVPAFLALWSTIFISRPASRAIVALTFANYLLQAFIPDCSSPPYYAVRLLAAAMLCLVMYVNCMGVKRGSSVQDILAVTKVLALIIIIVAGVHHLARGHVEHYLDPMKGTVWDVSSFATAFYSTVFAYSGWNSLGTIVEELKEPTKNLPRAIAISITIVTIVYTLTNVAYYAVLTPAEILSSNAVAVTFGGRKLGVLAWIIAFFVACSTGGNINGTIIRASRLTYAGAREGHLPQFLALININHYSPVTAVIVSAMIPLVALTSDSIGNLLAYTTFTSNVRNFTAVLGLLWLRYKEPDRPRPIKVWLGFPVFYLLVTLFLTVMPAVRNPEQLLVALGFVIVGLIIYYFIIHLKMKPKCLSKFMDKVTFVCQVLLMSSPEETGVFGAL